ncbi:uncharacterized protein LOC122934611 [Bufo gargarizans]|uniref:uncharacterized protein LOC122934611 n=1 Tax=Bufo gargarizans TaxID=30331 RepID=UPI001CF2F64D|nr:uncharacterized protein LOC122934611 [Bufo gargarizans]
MFILCWSTGCVLKELKYWKRKFGGRGRMWSGAVSSRAGSGACGERSGSQQGKVTRFQQEIKRGRSPIHPLSPRMGRVRRKEGPPSRIAAFRASGEIQDGARSPHYVTSEVLHEEEIPPARHISAGGKSPGHIAASPSPAYPSPSKRQQDLTINKYLMQEAAASCNEGSLLQEREIPANHSPPSPIVSGQSAPVTEATLRSLLYDLRHSIQKDISSVFSALQKDITQIGERTSHIEDKMKELTNSHNQLVDAHNDAEDEISALKLKLADLEDRSRRNNLRFRGITETIETYAIKDCLTDYFAALVPKAKQMDLLIDRAHRIPKPNSAPSAAPQGCYCQAALLPL